MKQREVTATTSGKSPESPRVEIASLSFWYPTTREDTELLMRAAGPETATRIVGAYIRTSLGNLARYAYGRYSCVKPAWERDRRLWQAANVEGSFLEPESGLSMSWDAATEIAVADVQVPGGGQS